MKKLLLILLLLCFLPAACAESLPLVTLDFTPGAQTGGTVFAAVPSDNGTALLLAQYGTLTLEMGDLNGNEKFAYLDDVLPECPKQMEVIKAGDILLFGNKCLVIFYQDTVSPFNYTRIGHVVQPEMLESALGNSDVTVQLIFAPVQN